MNAIRRLWNIVLWLLPRREKSWQRLVEEVNQSLRDSDPDDGGALVPARRIGPLPTHLGGAARTIDEAIAPPRNP